MLCEWQTFIKDDNKIASKINSSRRLHDENNIKNKQTKWLNELNVVASIMRNVAYF